MRDADRTHQTCTKCGETKPVADFDKNRDGKRGPILHAACRTCRSAVALAWFHANHERAIASQRRRSLKTLYGLTVAEYDALLAEQGGVCAICGEDEPQQHGRTGRKFRLTVDHDHQTGRVRGLLCQKCNRAIGLMREDVDRLKRAIYYLERT